MALENVAKIEEMLKTDKDLQAKVKELAAAYTGDKSDEKAVFEATVGALAAEAGLPVTYEEAVKGRSWQKLSDEEVEAVAGGSVCWFIGASPKTDDEDAYCAYVGITIDDTW